jgi:hypothetical protein
LAAPAQAQGVEVVVGLTGGVEVVVGLTGGVEVAVGLTGIIASLIISILYLWLRVKKSNRLTSWA